jgi:hypothetical protein
MCVDTATWTIKKEIQGIGPDLQTPMITYDGKYVLVPFSGFQRLSSGIAVIDAEADQLLGILPSNGGHHDCVIVPTQFEHMKHTRSCTRQPSRPGEFHPESLTDPDLILSGGEPDSRTLELLRSMLPFHDISS